MNTNTESAVTKKTKTSTTYHSECEYDDHVEDAYKCDPCTSASAIPNAFASKKTGRNLN